MVFHVKCRGASTKFGKAPNGAQRFRCKVCHETFIPAPVPRALNDRDRLPNHRRALISKLLRTGKSVRQIQGLTGHHQETILKYKKRIRTELPPCKCGRPMGHKGWCKSRLEHCLVRQAYNELMKRGGNNALKQLRPLQLALDNLIPDGLPADVKHEVYNSMFVDVLTGKLKSTNIREYLRTYISSAWASDINLISLDEPISEDGLTFGEILEG